MIRKVSTSITILAALVALLGCESSSSTAVEESSGEWLLPTSQIFDGGPGKDGIPAVGNPQFATVDQIDFLSDNDLVIGINVGGEIKAYAHEILDWHEIVNDMVGGEPIALTYCPLTGSAIGWGRKVGTTESSFGVSGLLYNTNLMPYDRATNSTWSQMTLKCVNGPLIGIEPEIQHVIETTWGSWKKLYPQSLVMTTNTGFNKPYGSYPYGDYRTNHSRLIFPISNDDGRIPRKTRVMGVIAGAQSKSYPIGNFGSGITLLEESLNGEQFVIVGSNAYNFAVAYSRRLENGTLLNFSSLSPDALPAMMSSSDSTIWDVFGIAIAGPLKGQRLTPALSYIAFWFAWGAFHPGTSIYVN